MKRYKIAQIILILLLTMTSCTKDSLSNEQEDFSIDLTLARQNDSQFAQEVLVLINEHRVSIGLDLLTLGSEFSCAYAVEHTNYMIGLSEINHDNFHTRSAALQSEGAQQVGENVAYGYSSAENVVNAWLNSTSHRDNIEGNYTYSSFGIIKSDDNNTYYFTQLFYKE